MKAGDWLAGLELLRGLFTNPMLRRGFRDHTSGAFKALPCVGMKLDFFGFLS